MDKLNTQLLWVKKAQEYNEQSKTRPDKSAGNHYDDGISDFKKGLLKHLKEESKIIQECQANAFRMGADETGWRFHGQLYYIEKMIQELDFVNPI
ncbi:MAG: hypothetical protein IM618_11260 [Cytophagales bacterium]|jgi:hypothetical protein|nr:hypothetical protein [Cytophagales bacterium]